MPTNTYVALQSTTLGSDVASYDFTSIPSTYTDLLIIGQFGNSGAGNAVGVQFNSDTGNNYSFTALGGTGSGSGFSDRLANTNHIYAAYNIAPSATVSGVLRLNVQNYSNTTTNKTVIARYDNNDATFPGASATAGLWRNTAAITTIRIKPSAGNLKAGSTFSLYAIAAVGTSPAAKATGGTIYADDQYYYHVFGSTGTFTPLSSLNADVLVVAGGGGGGVDNGGAGGAGGLSYQSARSLTTTGYSITVGGGGAAGTSAGTKRGSTGGNSTFDTITSNGGGGGGEGTVAGVTGGSGGAGGYNASGGAANQGNTGGATGYGFAGGASSGSSPYACGGGGGAGAVGATGTGTTAGVGGVGVATYSSWGIATGVGENSSGTYYFAGGGGGSIAGANPGGNGGLGGGGKGSGNSTAAINALSNTGGGGGGGVTSPGTAASAGGSGVVIIRYAK